MMDDLDDRIEVLESEIQGFIKDKEARSESLCLEAAKVKAKAKAAKAMVKYAQATVDAKDWVVEAKFKAKALARLETEAIFEAAVAREEHFKALARSPEMHPDQPWYIQVLNDIEKLEKLKEQKDND
jgi:hypothetical protein